MKLLMMRDKSDVIIVIQASDLTDISIKNKIYLFQCTFRKECECFILCIKINFDHHYFSGYPLPSGSLCMFIFI